MVTNPPILTDVTKYERAEYKEKDITIGSLYAFTGLLDIMADLPGTYLLGGQEIPVAPSKSSDKATRLW